MRRFAVLLAFSVALVGCSKAPAGSAAQQTIRISAASSMTDVLKESAAAFEAANPGVSVELNFAASGVLKMQIEQGAPVDVFVSASAKEMDDLAANKLIDATTRRDVASNQLVLVGPPDSPIASWNDLATSKVSKIAVSNPETVPSGRYAQETLEKRALIAMVKDRLVFGENVRQTLAYVLHGDTDAAIVFATDALTAGDRVKILDRAVNGVDHRTIDYPLAVVSRSDQRDTALKFARFLSSPEGQSILRRHGFTPPDR